MQSRRRREERARAQAEEDAQAEDQAGMMGARPWVEKARAACAMTSGPPPDTPPPMHGETLVNGQTQVETPTFARRKRKLTEYATLLHDKDLQSQAKVEEWVEVKEESPCEDSDLDGLHGPCSDSDAGEHEDHVMPSGLGVTASVEEQMEIDAAVAELEEACGKGQSVRWVKCRSPPVLRIGRKWAGNIGKSTHGWFEPWGLFISFELQHAIGLDLQHMSVFLCISKECCGRFNMFDNSIIGIHSAQVAVGQQQHY